MKKLFVILAAVFLAGCVPALAVDLVTATITATNNPANNDTITVNAAVRTWKTTVATPASQILVTNSIGATATNLYTHIAAYGFTGPLTLVRVGTNAVSLAGQPAQAMTVTASGTWATITYTTNTLTTTYAVRVPITVEAVNQRTNIASLLLLTLQDYPSNRFAMSSTFSNFVDTSTVQTLSNKTLSTGSIISGIMLTNSEVRSAQLKHYSNNLALKFYDSAGALEYAIAPDSGGVPSLYYVYSADNTNTPASAAYADQNILNALSGDQRYGKKAVTANSWTGTNTFTRITNSAIVGSAISQATAIGGTVTALTNGYWLSGGITNGAFTNSVLWGTQRFPRLENSALVAADNANVDFGSQTFVGITNGPGGNFSISGIQGGTDGRVLMLHNQTGNRMALLNNTGTAANRILTGTGGDVYFAGQAMVMLIYDASITKWLLMAVSEPPTQHAQPNTFWAGPVSGNATNAAFRQVNIGTFDIIGNLNVTNMNSGTSASASTFWSGAGTWLTPPSALGNTNVYNFESTQFLINNSTNVQIVSGAIITNLSLSGTVSSSTANANITLQPNGTGKVIIKTQTGAAGTRKIGTDEVSNTGTNALQILAEDGSTGLGAGIELSGYARAALGESGGGVLWLGYGSTGADPGIKFGLGSSGASGTERAKVNDLGLSVRTSNGSTSSTAGDLLVGDGVAATSVSSGTGNLNVGSALSVGTTLTIGGSTTTAGAVTTELKRIKALGAMADGAVNTLFTVTIPNASHTAVLHVRVNGAMGAGGTLGARSSASSGNYDIVFTRISGSVAVGTVSAQYGGAAATTPTTESVTTVVTLSAVSGAAGASNTCNVEVTVTRSAGASNNHTCVGIGELINAVATGVTFQ